MAGASRLAEFRRDLAWLSPSHRLSLLALCVLVILVATLSSAMPLLRNLERAVLDVLTASSAELVETDKRIVLIVYTDETLANTGQRSPLDRTILATALAQIDRFDPKAVGIDIMFDAPQDDDPVLLDALRAMRVPTFVATSDTERDPGSFTFEQAQFLTNFIARAGGTGLVRPANILLDVDTDGVVRRWPRQTGKRPALLAVALASAAKQGDKRFSEYDGAIRFKLSSASDRPVFDKFPIDLLADPAMAPFIADAIRGRYVLIGGDLADIDRFETPLTRMGGAGEGSSLMSGLEVHATMLAQMLDKAFIGAFPAVGKLAAAILCFVLGTAIAVFSRRLRVQIPLLLTLSAVIVAGSVQLARSLGTPTNIALAGWVLAALAAVLIVRSVRKAAQWEQGATATLALHRYLPPDIAKSIVTQPDKLGLGGELRQVFVMFTDLEGFTKMCQTVEPQVVAEFLNDYLERICQIILGHGGTIDKFVGDAVVAFWGAPVGRPDDGRRAVEAAVAIERETATMIGTLLGPLAVVGRTRIGIHYGTAIVGNFGGNGRLQYTALGDTMNVGARLEGANKELATSILASGELVAQVPELAFRRMGRVTVRGRNAPLDIFEPALSADPLEVARLNGFYDAALRGDSSALDAMSAWADDHPADIAMALLVRRLRTDELTAPTAL